MAGFGKILGAITARLGDRRGVSAVEYAILAVGIVIVVGAAVVAFGLVEPMQYASSALLSGQSSLNASAR